MAWRWDGRRVLQISPQRWDDIKLSKHHYAAEMAAMGAQVYFLEPPGAARRGEIKVTAVAENISVVQYAPLFPYALKFHARPLFDVLMTAQARRISRAVGGPLDLVWDFDSAYQFTDLSAFGASRSVFHLMDAAAPGRRGDKNADLVLSVSDRLLAAIKPLGAPARTITHGLGRLYAQHAARGLEECSQEAPAPFRRVGYVGNLQSTALDREAVLELARGFPDIEFHFVGPAPRSASSPQAYGDWLDALSNLPNCVLHGRQDAAYIIDLSSTIDAWLICYSLADDLNAGADSHKILEYFAMGGPVLSSWLAPYEGSPLVSMAERGSNQALAPLLRALIDDPCARTKPACDARRAYALGHSYQAKIKEVGDLLASLGTAPS